MSNNPSLSESSDASENPADSVNDHAVRSIIEHLIQRQQHEVGSTERGVVNDSLQRLLKTAPAKDTACALEVYESILLATSEAAYAAELDAIVERIRQTRGEAFTRALKHFNKIPGRFRELADHILLPPTPRLAS